MYDPRTRTVLRRLTLSAYLIAEIKALQSNMTLEEIQGRQIQLGNEVSQML